jgi:3-oxoacyl-(acyl-carrier-protein) synthase
MSTEERPVVRGVGVMAPPGAGVDVFWDGMVHGRTTIGPITSFDASAATTDIAGWFPADVDLPPPGNHDRLLGALAIVVEEACRGAGWTERDDVSLVVGTTELAGPAFEAAILTDAPDASVLVARLGPDLASRTRLGGPALTTCSASASGAVAVGVALDLLRTGAVPRVVVAAGDVITRAAYLGLNSLRTLSRAGCRPFSPQRRGIRIAESAAALALELGPVGAHPDVVVSGYGASSLASNSARPEPRGIRLAVEACLADASLAAHEIDLVNLHGPGTRHGDRAEIDALSEILGDRLPRLPLISSKPVLGHGQGGAGLVEIIVTLLALQRATIPATHGLTDVEPVWACLDFVPESRPAALRTGLSISCGLGGINTATLVSFGRGSS